MKLHREFTVCGHVMLHKNLAARIFESDNGFFCYRFSSSLPRFVENDSHADGRLLIRVRSNYNRRNIDACTILGPTCLADNNNRYVYRTPTGRLLYLLGFMSVRGANAPNCVPALDRTKSYYGIITSAGTLSERRIGWRLSKLMGSSLSRNLNHSARSTGR